MVLVTVLIPRNSSRNFDAGAVTNDLCTLKCLRIGTPKTINFPFVANGKLMVLGVPIFEHTIIRL